MVFRKNLRGVDHMNPHLNLFVPYSQSSDNPVENNLSRGVAILLDENPLFFDRLIDLINRGVVRSEKAIAKPTKREDRVIDVQISASKLVDIGAGIQRIIPVTLTPQKIEADSGNSNTANPIPDIIISCGGEETSDLILIEVKQYTLNADSQVERQAISIRDNIQEKSHTDVSIIEPVVKLDWEEIIKILQEIERLQVGQGDFVLSHYLDYLKEYRQGWFPVEPFTIGMSGQMMWKRIEPLARNCAKLLAEGKEEDVAVEDSGWSYKLSFTPSLGYMKEVHFYWHGSKDNVEGLTVGLWLGNTNEQSWALFAGDKTREDMSWTRSNKVAFLDTTLDMTVKPFLKFAHFQGKHVMGAYLSSDVLGSNKSNIREEFCNRLNGRWKRGEEKGGWGELEKYLLSTPGLLEDAKSFEKEFGERIKKSGKNFIDVSLGYEIGIYLPLEDLEAMDKVNSRFMDSPQSDAVAQLIADGLRNLRKMIEKQ